MKKNLLILLAFIGILNSCKETNPSELAETIYINGKIYTVNEAQPWAEAVALKDGKFLLVGTNDEIMALKGAETEIIDLEGKFAMPGIIDTHIHPGLLMTKRAYCALPGTFYEPSEKDILDALNQAISNYPKDKEWFIGHGFSTPAMSPKTLTRKVLDELIPDKPAWIEDESGHNAWFNTKAMELVGVSKDFKDTKDAFFSRTADGDLAGVAYEGAMNFFLNVLPPTSTEDRKDAYLVLLDEALSKGITAFGEAYVFQPELQAWQELKQENKLNQHLNLYLAGNLGTNELTPVDSLEKWWNAYDLPGKKGVKMGMGGTLESYSEALIDGYADPKKIAKPIVDAEKFAAYVAQLDKAGFQLKIHAIGDGSVRATIDGYESVIKKNGNNRLRHHIDHAALVHPDDFQRLVDLDISVTIWPPLNAPIAYNMLGIKPVLKLETWKRMYANRDLFDAGVRLVNHTDAPAATLWPWWGMEASTTRAFPGKPEKGTLNPEQALTVEELVKIYTINSAWSLRIENVTGSIEEGKFADMIILNHNLFEIAPTEIHNTKVHLTIFKGKEVYSKK